MAYQDPYSQHYSYNNAPAFSEPQYGYAGPPMTYPPYDAGQQAAATTDSRPPFQHTHSSSYSSTIEKRNPRVSSFGEPPKDTGELRLWRHGEHGNLWTKGGRGRCIGRFCCCSIMSVLFTIIAIALSLAMWLRPPDVSFGSISPPTTGSAIEATSTNITINLALPINVRNPNYFTASFEQISAVAYYPLNHVAMGGGSKDNIAFPAYSDTTFNFPFSIDYSPDKDPGSAILLDISNRCGFTGNPAQQILVDYDITLRIKILTFSISPSFNGQAGFNCPLTKAQVQPFLNGVLGGSGS